MVAALTALTVFTASACAGSGRAARPPSPTSSVATAAAASTPASLSVSVSVSVSPEAGSTAGPTTGAATTTTIGPAPLVAARVVLPDRAAERTTMTIADLGAGPTGFRALAAGWRASKPGEAPHAVVLPLADDATPVPVADLPVVTDGASFARAVAVHDAVTLVAGSVEHGDGQQPALWRSDDGGATFVADGLPWSPASGMAVAAGFADADPVVVAQLVDAGRVVVALARRTAGRWTTSSLPVDGRFAEVAGLSVPSAEQVVVTGSQVRDTVRRAVVWHSVDGGATFTADRLGDGYRAVSAPAADGTGLVVVATRAADGGLDLVRSPDGAVWSPTALDIARADGTPTTLQDSEPPNVAAAEGHYLFGAVDVTAVVVSVDASGRGVVDNPATFVPWAEVFRRSPRVLLAGERVLAGLQGETTFKLATGSFRSGRTVAADWDWADRLSAAVASGPTVHDVALSRTAVGPMATVMSYPHVSSTGDGRLSWRPLVQSSSAPDGRTWGALSSDDLLGTVDLVVTDGTADVAIDLAVDDPADGSAPGPRGGTAVRLRQAGGPWSEPSLVLSGPGGDSARDAARTADGWLVVGERRQFDAEGSTIVDPVLAVGDGASWRPVAVEGLSGQARLTKVVGSPGGPSVVLGEVLVAGDWKPIVLGRRADGTWAPVTIPSVVTPTLYGGVADADGVTLLAREGDDAVLYRSTDGSTFTRRAVSLPDPAASFPTQLVVTPAGLQVLVGSVWHAYTERLAVWTSADGATWVPRQVDDGSGVGASSELTIDAALVSGDVVVVSGVVRRQGVVWTVPMAG